MFKKMCVAAILTGILISVTSVTNVFAEESCCQKDRMQILNISKEQSYEKGRTEDCPDDCKCGPDIDCKDQGCEKSKTDTCICGK